MKNDIIRTGYDGRFNPNAYGTRADTAAALRRIIEPNAKAG
jgi:hypothetical protein